MADYNSQYTGDEIDSAVGRALPGGAIDVSVGTALAKANGTFNSTAVTVDLAASELQSYINALPRNLNQSYVLRPSGTLTGNLTFAYFFGNGAIRISPVTAGDFTLIGRIYCVQCSIPIQVWDINVQSASGSTTESVVTSQNLYLRLSGITFTGSGANRCVSAYGTGVIVMETCKASNYLVVIFAERGVHVDVYATAATDFHDNTTGIQLNRGGIVLLGGNAPNLLGGAANVHGGGIIANDAGALI